MPHTELGKEELDLAYPSLDAVEELELNDLTRLEDEPLYGAGMKIVQAILDEMAVSGRTRRAAPEEAQESHECTAQKASSRAPRIESLFCVCAFEPCFLCAFGADNAPSQEECLEETLRALGIAFANPAGRANQLLTSLARPMPNSFPLM